MNVKTFTLCECAELVNNEVKITKPFKFIMAPKLPFIFDSYLVLQANFEESETEKPQKLIFSIFGPDGTPFDSYVLNENLKVPTTYYFSTRISITVKNYGSHSITLLIGNKTAEFKFIVMPLPDIPGINVEGTAFRG